MSSANDKLISARAALVLEEPFFGALVLGLNLVPDTSCATAWVNGREIGYNPKFIESLSHSQVMGLLAHEVMHCASGHPWRRDGRDSRRWNIACDRAINNVLLDAGFKLPENGELATGDEVGKSAEFIFNRLPESQPNGNESSEKESQQDSNGDDSQDGAGDSDPDSGDDSSDDSGDGEPSDGAGDEPGDVRDAPTPQDETDDTPTEEDWQQAVQQAAIQAKVQGKLPGSLARFAAETVKPRVDWRSVLRRFIQTFATADYSWKSPNPRYIASGLYLPSLHSETLGEIAIAVDTSGSIDDTALAMAKSEIETIVSEVSPSNVIVYYADSEIARIDEFPQGEAITWNPCGGGGTDFRPVFSDMESRANLPACLIYITDMEGTFPENSDVPTLWLTDNLRITTAPFGEIIPITD